MQGFTLRKFNQRTAELIGRPDLGDSPGMHHVEANGGICGVRQMAGFY